MQQDMKQGNVLLIIYNRKMTILFLQHSPAPKNKIIQLLKDQGHISVSASKTN